MILPLNSRTAHADSRSRRGGRCLFTLLVGLALFPGMASAYSQLIVFGDSLSDAGQFPDVESIALGEIGSLRFTNRLGPSFQAPSPYGEVSTQRLADALGLAPLLPSTSIVREQLGLPDGTNYATGGYTTAQILDSITQPSGSVVDADLVSRTRDGYLVEVGTADPLALYYLNGGGNDFFSGLVTGPAEAAVSAGTLADGLDALVAAGARTIVVSNLPDVGVTPAGLASGRRDAYSALVQVYNQALGERLAGYDGRVEIIRLNVGALFDEVVAAPADFGLATGVPLTDVCFSAPGCDVTPFGMASNNPDPGKLLFNDELHPTTAGQQILADYVFTLLEAPHTLALVGEMTVGALNAQQQSVVNALRPGVQSEGVRVYVHGDHHDDQRDGFSKHGFSDAGRREASQRGAGVGVVVPVGQGWLGAAVTQRRAELEAPAEFELDGQTFSLFARQHLGRVGVQAVVSHGDFDLDLRRHATLGQAERTMKGETDAEGWAAELRADYRLTSSDSPWYTAPFIAYRHVDVEIDGYREAGSVANALIVSEQDAEDRQLELGLMMDRSLEGGVGVFGEFAWGEYLDDEWETAEVRLASLPSNRWSGEANEREDDHYLRFDTGLRVQIGNALLQAGAGMQGRDSLSPHFQLGASFTF